MTDNTASWISGVSGNRFTTERALRKLADTYGIELAVLGEEKGLWTHTISFRAYGLVLNLMLFKGEVARTFRAPADDFLPVNASPASAGLRPVPSGTKRAVSPPLWPPRDADLTTIACSGTYIADQSGPPITGWRWGMTAYQPPVFPPEDPPKQTAG